MARQRTQDLVLQVDFVDSLEQAVANTIDFLPLLVGAIIILLIGWVIGRLAAGAVRRLAGAVDLDGRMEDTVLQRALGGGERAISRGLGRIVAYYVYLLALLAAANLLNVEVLSEWVASATAYLPSFVAGLLIIVLGFVLADFVADAIASTETVTAAEYAGVFADGVRFFLYFVVLVMGLDTMEVDVQILFLFSQAVAVGLAVGIALAIGIAFGWGGRDFVADNIEGWVGRGTGEGRRTTGAQADGGTDDPPSGGTPQSDGGTDADRGDPA